ncbi:MAG: NCS2 family permease [Erysipelotrichaceae bacterium]|jgi:AGZA family xanthine/uracil permease-like MFS transporter|nr:NCS2 family permease [Erysipelotrichaceae bacterium]
MKFLENLFNFKARGSSLKTEIIGGIVTFIAMCYILPVNAGILKDMGMNEAGVFASTAIVGCLVTMIMGLVANYPIALSAGMGLNAYITYSVAGDFGFSWQEAMILLTITGILFLIMSLTPLRRIIIETIPKDLKLIISAGLGAFICFVGLKGAGIVTSNASTLVGIGNLSSPAVLIALIGAILTLGLMFIKHKGIANMAIPIGILFAAVIGVATYLIIYYAAGADSDLLSGLPVAPWLDNGLNSKWFANGFGDVIFYGYVGSDIPTKDFGTMILDILSNPGSYIAIFSMIFVNLFDTTSTLLAIGRDAGMIDHDGKIKNYQRAVLADATGAAICAPLGTSTVTSFAESGVGVSMGAKTGLASVVTALLFLLAAFIFPVFSIFTFGSVTAPALIAVGAMIFVNNFKAINFDDKIAGFTGFITVIMILLTYSISSGLGIGIITYCVMMLFARRHKEVSLITYIIAGLFVLSFAANELIKIIPTV